MDSRSCEGACQTTEGCCSISTVDLPSRTESKMSKEELDSKDAKEKVEADVVVANPRRKRLISSFLQILFLPFNIHNFDFLNVIKLIRNEMKPKPLSCQ